jgi:two-component system, NarL family, response regulator YdfI
MTPIASPRTATASSRERRACRIVVVDSQRILRQALPILLAAEKEFAVVGDAGQGAEALELIGALKPDVVVTDLHVTEGSGVQLIEQIHARFPKVAILVLTALRAHDVVAAVRKAGALGYVLKDRGRGELLSALREVAAGRWYRSIAPAVSASRAWMDEGGSLSTRAAYLTQRQRQVLRWVALGYQAREIAQKLGVSVRAVHKQRERLRDALQLNSTAALTRFAAREGLTQAECGEPVNRQA